jgi:hypothetical protein
VECKTVGGSLLEWSRNIRGFVRKYLGHARYPCSFQTETHSNRKVKSLGNPCPILRAASSFQCYFETCLLAWSGNNRGKPFLASALARRESSRPLTSANAGPASTPYPFTRGCNIICHGERTDSSWCSTQTLTFMERGYCLLRAIGGGKVGPQVTFFGDCYDPAPGSVCVQL